MYENDIKTFNIFIEFLNIFIPHLVVNSNSETNVIKIDDTYKDVTIENFMKYLKCY
jgi:hypothetical protein